MKSDELVNDFFKTAIHLIYLAERMGLEDFEYIKEIFENHKCVGELGNLMKSKDKLMNLLGGKEI